MEQFLIIIFLYASLVFLWLRIRLAIGKPVHNVIDVGLSDQCGLFIDHSTSYKDLLKLIVDLGLWRLKRNFSGINKAFGLFRSDSRPFKSRFFSFLGNLLRAIPGIFIGSMTMQMASSRNAKIEKKRKTYEFFVTHPKRFYLEDDYAVMVYIYPPNLLEQVESSFSADLDEKDVKLKNYATTAKKQSEHKPFQIVTLKFECLEIGFRPAEKTIKLSDDAIHIDFLAKPSEKCAAGKHKVMLNICDQEKVELKSIQFNVYATSPFFNRFRGSIITFVFGCLSLISAITMGILDILKSVNDLTAGSGIVISLIMAFSFFSYSGSFTILQKTN